MFIDIFTPGHVQLLNACYPPTSSLLAAASGYSPNSHELSRLTYFAYVFVIPTNLV